MNGFILAPGDRRSVQEAKQEQHFRVNSTKRTKSRLKTLPAPPRKYLRSTASSAELTEDAEEAEDTELTELEDEDDELNELDARAEGLTATRTDRALDKRTNKKQNKGE